MMASNFLWPGLFPDPVEFQFWSVLTQTFDLSRVDGV